MDNSYLQYHSLADIILLDATDHVRDSQSVAYLDTLNYNPLQIDSDWYNNDNDVNAFLTQMRNLNTTQSEYIFMDIFPLYLDANTDTFTLLNMNIRGITANFQ